MKTLQATLAFLAEVEATLSGPERRDFQMCIQSHDIAHMAMAYACALDSGYEEIAIDIGANLPQCVSVPVWEFLQK